MSPIRRSLKLLLNYWVVFAIFIPMGCIIAPEDYSLSTECILNFTTLINSYNNEWWFLFPYLLLVFTCKPFFQNHSPIIAKTRLDINKCYCNWLFSSILLHFNQLGLCMMRIEQYFTLLFPFLCGAVLPISMYPHFLKTNHVKELCHNRGFIIAYYHSTLKNDTWSEHPIFVYNTKFSIKFIQVINHIQSCTIFE